MKNIFLLIGFVLMFSCSKNENSGNKDVIATEQDTEVHVITDPIAEGKSLIEGADCLGCHKINDKLIGPSYKELADKYENTPENVNVLADKIINGSAGIWGDVPMPAHHGMSQENAKFMVQYILSLK